MIGLRIDSGKAHSLGAGYIHAHEFGIGWVGYGADLAVAGVDFGQVDAVLGYALARLVIGHAPPGGLEVALGVGNAGGDLQAVGRVGGYISFYYVDFGYSYSFPMGPFESPEWLSSHQFSLRVHLPVHRYARWEQTIRAR